MNLDAEVGSVLTERTTMARFVFLSSFVFAPSNAVVILNRSSFNSAVAIAGASISVTQVSTG